jgi:hypothetical protein
MAADFEISFVREQGSFRLDLAGDFDEQAAGQLLEALQKHCREAPVLFIRARHLKKILPSGREAFQKNLHVLGDFRYRLVFADTNATQIAPGWIDYF